MLKRIASFAKKISPLQQIKDHALDKAGVNVLVKRDDLIHPAMGGNKWRKLKYNLIEANRQGLSTLLTFGGAYSNHLYATAAAGQYFGFDTIGFVRGEAHFPLNPTLHAVTQMGMQLHYLSRSTYRNPLRALESFADPLPPYYYLPEGGTNPLALVGCAELAKEILDQCAEASPDYYCLSCGTGGTMSGLLIGLEGKGKVIGFSALKGDFMASNIQALLDENAPSAYSNWQMEHNYHFGGYARHTLSLIEFINAFHAKHQIPLDPIYTGKLFYGLWEWIAQGRFAKGSTIVVIHSGGLQGIKGFNQRQGKALIEEDGQEGNRV